MPNLIPTGSVADRIHYIRGLKVMVDDDLARVYGVAAKRLNQQVHRNKERFPRDFMFQLPHEETNALRLQSATFVKSECFSAVISVCRLPGIQVSLDGKTWAPA